MKKVEAIIRPNKVAEVVSGLSDVVYESLAMSALYVHEYGLGIRKQWLGNSYVEDPPRAKIEVLVDDALVDRVVHIITTRAFTGSPGDGTIMVLEVAQVINVSSKGRAILAQ